MIQNGFMNLFNNYTSYIPTNDKDMYQKSMKGVIGTHFKSKEFFSSPNHSSNISIKKDIGNDMERLKIESK